MLKRLLHQEPSVCQSYDCDRRTHNTGGICVFCLNKAELRSAEEIEAMEEFAEPSMPVEGRRLLSIREDRLTVEDRFAVFHCRLPVEV